MQEPIGRRHSEWRSLESASHEYFLALGFSPQLATYMRRVNDVLAKPTPTYLGHVVPVERVSIVLAPDKSPRPVVETQFSEDYQIRLDAYLKRKFVRLSIGNGRSVLANVGLGNLQQFVGELHPDRPASLFPRDFYLCYKGGEQVTPLDFLGLTREGYERLPYGDYFVSSSDHLAPISQGEGGHLLVDLLPSVDIRFTQGLCSIKRFVVDGKSQKVEQAINLVSQLFANDPFRDPKYFDQFLRRDL